MQLTVVDAFSDRPFRGNPAAVAVLAGFPEDGLLQQIADEVHLSETAFLVARPDGDHDLRWFTPTVEVDLCGHATLAAAHVLGEPVARFHTRSGLLTCSRAVDGQVDMDFPTDPPAPWQPPGELLRTLPEVRWAGRAREDVLVELEEAAAVRDLLPDLSAMAAVGSRAVIVTAPGDQPGVDFVSRVFGPNVGVPEDPVTGSAHCPLGAHWGERTGRSRLVGEQVSRRGGTVSVVLRGDRVTIGGQAVTTGRIELDVVAV